jgi:NADPH-dependent 2,4-dienoyl-CoA reductase/sulfur reductase-like enzyme
MAAAAKLASAGQRVAVFDEQRRPGGQLLRQPPSSFVARDWLPGRIYAEHKDRLQRIEGRADIDWRLGTSVWGLFRADDRDGFDVHFTDGDTSRRLSARRVLIAAGCYEMPVPLPGWTLPGVMTAGAMQTLLKSQGLIAGNRIVLSGSHPLQLVLADQLLTAGARIEKICFAQPWHRALRGLRSPGVLLSKPGPWLEVVRILLRLVRAGIPVQFSSCVRRVEGSERVLGVEIAPVRQGMVQASETEFIGCDAVALCFGFLPSSELARQAGARALTCEGGGWRVESDGEGRSSQPDFYVAGETTGVKGGDSAVVEGELAALSILADAGLADARVAQPGILRRQMHRHRRFARLLDEASRMDDAFYVSLVDSQTMICRCEDVSLGDLQTIRAENPLACTVGAVKRLCRAGMGVCQGRQCEVSVQRLLGHVAGLEPTVTSAYTARAPVRPVSIDQLCNSQQPVPINAFELERELGALRFSSNKESHEEPL